MEKKRTYLPYNVKLRDRARDLRKNMTEAESRIWREYLRDFAYPVLRQKPLGNYIVDFYCSSLRLVIEIDGPVHESREQIEYDMERDAFLQGHGLTVLRFTNNEVMNHFPEVCGRIDKFCARG